MLKIAIYGKGGIGKSTISSNISACLAKNGKKVLHVGCDPKQDSTIKICKNIVPALDIALSGKLTKIEDIIFKGKYNIDCIECGGPKPGVGCAGRGVQKVFEIFDEYNILQRNYDIALFDVLGDVVCGGFATPLKEGYANLVIIVISEEIMSLYAANNILNAVDTYKDNDIQFGGFILNKSNETQPTQILDFLKETNTQILCKIPFSEKLVQSERLNQPMIEAFPDSKLTRTFLDLSLKLQERNTYSHKKIINFQEALNKWKI